MALQVLHRLHLQAVELLWLVLQTAGIWTMRREHVVDCCARRHGMLHAPGPQPPWPAGPSDLQAVSLVLGLLATRKGHPFWHCLMLSLLANSAGTLLLIDM